VSGGTVHTAVTSSEDETVALGAALSRQLRPGDVVTLDGPLGAGKTRFVRGMAIGLGHDSTHVSSPTFVVAHEYATPGARAILIHVDAYRLSGDDDSALGIGWDQVIGGEAIVAIEWPQRIAALLPESCFSITMAHAGPTSRRITITSPAGRSVTISATS
jgi:tRNA threonylcarbamoyladenosine biosynthesis protein TsaE